MSAFKGFTESQISVGDDDDPPSVRYKSPKNKVKSPLKKSPPSKSVIKSCDQTPVPPEALLSAKPQSPIETNHDASTESQDPDLLDGISLDDDKESYLSKIEKMEQRRKEIEENNKKTRKMLTEALANRQQRTAEEVKKLSAVQGELQKIDQVVAQDVKILRQTIEMASHDFAEAQRRYDQAEKEFVEAKLNLHMKQERKELLTEHLITIIEQSEIRKASKLAQLMDRLQIEE